MDEKNIIMRECKDCKTSKELYTNYKRNLSKNGKYTYLRVCKKCFNIKRSIYFKEYHKNHYKPIKTKQIKDNKNQQKNIELII